MSEKFKFPFPGFGPGFVPFGYPPTGAMLTALGDFYGVQQQFFTALTKFGQETVTLLNNDLSLGADVMSRMFAAKTPEEFAATQRDMFELVGSKYLEQMFKFGEEMKGLFVKTGDQVASATESFVAAAKSEVAPPLKKAA